MNMIDEVSRFIGQFEEFRKATNHEFETIGAALVEINRKLDTLQALRWKMAGAAFVVSLLVSGIVVLLPYIVR